MKQVKLTLTPDEAAALRYILYAGLANVNQDPAIGREIIHDVFNAVMDSLNDEGIGDIIEPETVN